MLITAQTVNAKNANLDCSEKCFLSENLSEDVAHKYQSSLELKKALIKNYDASKPVSN